MRLRLPIIIAAAVLIPIALFVFKVFRRANQTADASAHAALTAEIRRELALIPAGQPYPQSLSYLLKYPDDGDARLLKRFEYRSDGTSCMFRTTMRYGGEVSYTFPSSNSLFSPQPSRSEVEIAP